MSSRTCGAIADKGQGAPFTNAAVGVLTQALFEPNSYRDSPNEPVSQKARDQKPTQKCKNKNKKPRVGRHHGKELCAHLPHSPAFSPTPRYKQIPPSSPQSTPPDVPFPAATGVTSELSPLGHLQKKKHRLSSNSVYIPTKEREMKEAQSHLRNTSSTPGDHLHCSLS